MKNKIVSNHGDLVLLPIDKLIVPKTAKKAKLHVLQDSGATGNRHEVITDKGFIFRWTKDGREYLHCDNDYKIRHVGGDCEHGEQLVEAGTREIKHEIEYDPWKKELRRVID
jgi:hypothetical protein